ncbi:unnamed protein product [Urochloa humidicola]
MPSDLATAGVVDSPKRGDDDPRRRGDPSGQQKQRGFKPPAAPVPPSPPPWKKPCITDMFAGEFVLFSTQISSLLRFKVATKILLWHLGLYQTVANSPSSTWHVPVKGTAIQIWSFSPIP